MNFNLERYKKDLESLIEMGAQLQNSLQYACFPDELRSHAEKELGEKTASFLKGLPDFDTEYQSWYSEAKALIRQLLPDRLADFVRHYEKPKARKMVTFESYRIEDCLQGIVREDNFGRTIAGPESAIPHLRQQCAIVKAVHARFESSLFDIRQLAMADLFDSELDAASELVKKGFLRGAGAMAGVVLESHLAQVCANHSITWRKKAPTIGDFNDMLKAANVVDTPQWRSIQHLADLRNLCDHKRATEPSAEEVKDLIRGVAKVVKNLF